MGFLVPLFAGFALLAGVPLLVHLYGRPRAQRQRFAAIRFLIESDRKTATQRRLREVALLLARAAAMAAVPLLLAKPYLEIGSTLSAGIGEGESAVIVLDDSRSMGALVGSTSRFVEAKARARRLVSSLGRDSEAALLLTSQGAAAPQAELTADRQRLLSAIEAARLSQRPGDSTAALRRAAAILGAPRTSGGAARGRKVYLVSDLAAHGFSGPPPWGDQGPTLVPVDVSGKRGDDNRAVVELRAAPAPALGPRGVEIVAVVRNLGATPQRELGITLRIDGKAVAKGLIDLPAHGRAEKRFFHSLGAPAGGAEGSAGEQGRDDRAVHEAVVEIAADVLPSDDRRFLRLEERRGLRVLLLDGDPRPVRRDDELFYLETALRPGDRSDSHIAVEVATLEDLPRLSLAAVDVVFAANLKAPDPERARRLAAFVAEGGGLLLSVGDNVDPEGWNQALGDLLPQPLAAVRTVAATPRGRDDGESAGGGVATGQGEHIARLEREHPVLSPFAGGSSGARGPAQALREARVARYVLLKPTPRPSGLGAAADDEGRRALLRLDSGAPLLVEGRHGRGRVLLLTTTVDRDWGDLAIQPGFLPLVQQAARYLARAPLSAPEAASLVGQPHEIPLAEGDSRLEVSPPEGRAARWFGEERVIGRRALHYLDTDEPGLYHVAAASGGGPMAPRPLLTFAVNVDDSESDLTPIDPAQLQALSRPSGGPLRQAPVHRLELWHQLGGLLLVLLLIEGLLTLRR